MKFRYGSLIALVLLTLSCTAADAYAQTFKGSVEGIVVIRWRDPRTKKLLRKGNDYDEDVVRYANIKFSGPGEDYAVTDHLGHFSVRDLPVGLWTLIALTPPPDSRAATPEPVSFQAQSDITVYIKIPVIRPLPERTKMDYKRQRLQLVFYRMASFDNAARGRGRAQGQGGTPQGKPLPGQEPSGDRVIKGKVIDEAGKAVGGAVVRILGADTVASSPLLRGEEIANASELVLRLRNGQDAFSQYVRASISPATKQLLDNYGGIGPLTPDLRESLVVELNKLLSSPALFDEARFAGVKLRPMTQELLAKSPTGTAPVELNRLLLEDAYPGQINKSQRLPLKITPLDQVETNETGEYEFRLPAGKSSERYLLLVNKTDYQPHTSYLPWAEEPAPEIVLRKVVGEEVNEEVAMTSFDAARRGVFSPVLMKTLPVPGTRSFDYFALLAPGVLPPPETSGAEGPGLAPYVGSAGQFAVNGLRSRENNFTVDGSDNNDEDIGTRRQGFVLLTPQSIESLQEFQVITALADARFGRNLGGQVNALTKSGTYGLSGEVYGLFTHDRLNARNFFDQSVAPGEERFTLKRSVDNTPVLLDGSPLVVTNPVGGEDKLERSQGGATLSGYLPPLNTFFFGSAEFTHVRATKESHFAVPTVAERGFFGTGETGAFVNDIRNVPINGNGIIFPATLPGDAVFSLYPFPNNPSGPYGANTYSAVLPADGKGFRLVGKLSHQFGSPNPERKFKWWHFLWATPGDTLTGRYNFTQDRSTLPVTGGALFSTLRPWVRTQNVAFFFNRTIAANLTDTIRFSFGRTRLTFDEVRDAFLSPSTFFPGTQFLLNAPLLLNATRPNQDGTLNPTTYVSASSPQGVALLATLGPGTALNTAEQIAGPLGQVVIPGFSPLGVDVNFFPQARANNTFQIADTMAYVRKAHTYYFGFDIRKTQINSTQDKGFRPAANFNGLLASAPLPSRLSVAGPNGPAVNTRFFSGATLAAAGVPTGVFQTLAVEANSDIGLRFTQVNLFLQDEWRARPNLSLTYGLRYEVNTIPDTVGRRLERAFDPEELNRSIAAALPECIAAQGAANCNVIVETLRAAFPADFRLSFGADRNDFDVRLGFAWDMRGNRRTVLRGGLGSYTGQFNGLILGQSRNAFPNFLPLNFAATSRPGIGRGSLLSNPSNPILRLSNPSLSGLIRPGSLNTIPAVDPVAILLNVIPFAGTGTVGLDLMLPQRELTTPYSLQYGLTLEHVVGNDYLVSLAYVGTRGVKLLRVSTPERGVNLSQLEGNLAVSTRLRIRQINGGTSFPAVDGTILAPQEVIQKSGIRLARTFFESSSTSRYNSLQAEVRKRYSRFFQFGTAFTLSKSNDDASDYLDTAGAFALPQNSLDTSEWGPSGFDVRLRSVTNFVVDLPHNFQASGIVTAQTGQPFTVNSAFDVNRDGNLTDRLNNTNGLLTNPVEGDESIRLGLAPGTDPSSLLAPDGLDGALGRNSFRARGLFSFDLAASKLFKFRNEQELQFRCEVFNLFNRANFAIPERILESPAFGRSVRTNTPARTIQLRLKYSF